MSNSRVPILEMRGITKRFPGVLALDHVDLMVYPGQVLALVGENGAGKSTLMKVLSGVHQMDEGEILMEGKPVKIDNPLASQLMGISIIYQELSVLDNMNIAENIFLGREKRKGSMFVDKKSMHGEARKLLDEVGLDVDTRTMAGELSTAQKQMIEVAKALSFNSKIIIMDEPTSSLTETETEILFGIIRKLRDKGVAIVFISHKLAEIFAITDEVAILRDGVSAGRMVTEGCSENDIIKAMVGRDVNDLYAKQAAPIGDVVLEVKNLSTKGFLKETHQLMSDLANRGVAIIMISSELPEVLGMSDRVIVMHEGRVKGQLSREEADQVSIMKMAVTLDQLRHAKK